MSISALRTNLYQLIDKIENEQILNAIYTLAAQQAFVENDFWEELTAIQRGDIEAGLADLDAGRSKRLEDVLKKYE
jgi:predicted transcriptional regulator